jgi:hypothetical protein
VKLGLAASQNPYLLNDLLKSEGSSFEKLTHEIYIYHFILGKELYSVTFTYCTVLIPTLQSHLCE